MAADGSSTAGRKYILNTAFGGMSWFLPILVSFASTPIILRHLGVEQYGLYATVLGFISYSFAFGIGKVLVKYVAEYRSTGESEKISIVVASVFWISVSLASAGAVIAVIFAGPLVRSVLAIPEPQQNLAVVGIYLVSATIVVAMPSQAFQFILQGLHRFGTFLLLSNSVGLILVAGNILLAVLGYDMRFLLGWNLVCLAILAAAYGFVARRDLPEFSLSLADARRVPADLLRYSGSVILYQMIGNVLFLFERGIVIREFGAETAAYYLIPMTLGIYLHGATASLLQATFPLLNELLASPERLIRLYEKAAKLTLAIVAFALVSVAFSGKTFLSLWIDAAFAERSFGLLAIHCVTFGLIAIWINGWSLAEGFRQPRFTVIVTAIWSAVAIPLMLVAANAGSVSGVALSRLAGVAVTVPMIFYFEKRFLGRPLWSFWARVCLQLGLSAFCAGVVQFVIIRNAPFSPIIDLFAAVALSGVVFGIVAVATGFADREERNALFSFLRRKRV